MNPVRLGVIGCGGMARAHMTTFNQIPGLDFLAAADVAPEALDLVTKSYPSVKTFTDGTRLLDSGLVDAVLIATPHYFHPVFAIQAFERNIHVLSEKPVAVSAKAAQEAIDAHRKKPKLVYACMFQLRTVPVWKKVKEILESGELGAIRRVIWIVTAWFRSQAYYDSGTWRATWAGEGGGVLLNQCPHNLDLITWFAGTPCKVHAHVGIARHHDIEVEDDVTAYLEYPNGSTGLFVTSTGEAPGSDRLEIAGDQGKLVVENGTLTLWETQVPVSQFLRTSRESFSVPPVDKITIEVGGKSEGHLEITRNFIEAIQKPGKVPLIAPAEEGIRGLELGNAMLMSGLTGKSVPIPTQRDGFERLLKKLIRSSKFEKKADAGVIHNLDNSFKH